MTALHLISDCSFTVCKLRFFDRVRLVLTQNLSQPDQLGFLL